MLLSERNRHYLDAMVLVEHVSQSLETTSWVWGGFMTDIHAGRVLREHGDVDYLTLNLHQLRGRFAEAFSSHGWQSHVYENGDLRLKKDDVRLHLGNVELGEVVRWTHNGEKGSLLFPPAWLSPEVMPFHGTELHVVAAELQYVLKEHPEFLNPDWQIREKDILEKECLRDMLLNKGIDVCSLHTLVSSV